MVHQEYLNTQASGILVIDSGIKNTKTAATMIPMPTFVVHRIEVLASLMRAE
jgi:hypothetical protein